MFALLDQICIDWLLDGFNGFSLYKQEFDAIGLAIILIIIWDLENYKLLITIRICSYKIRQLVRLKGASIYKLYFYYFAFKGEGIFMTQWEGGGGKVGG